MLALADAVTMATVTASLAAFGPGLSAAVGALLFAPAWIVAAKLYGLYDRDHRTLRHLTIDELPIICVWAITWVAGLALFLEAVHLSRIDAQTAIRTLGIALAAALVLRSFARSTWRRITPPERVVIIGSDGLARSIRRKLELFSDIHASVTGEYAAISPEILRNGHGWGRGVDRIILAARAIDERLIALLKRLLDVAVAAVVLVLAAPLFALTVLAIRLSSAGPAFYVQTRVGLCGREFKIYKFRTMLADAEDVLLSLVEFDALDEPVFKLARDPRVTRLGRVLRRTSLDELPQLLNVLKGEMSLVGPRPEQVELVRRYRPEHLFRLAVKPGLTGPMQVFGRGRLSFEERLSVEREYIENLSISRDLRILALTVPSVFDGRGAY